MGGTDHGNFMRKSGNVGKDSLIIMKHRYLWKLNCDGYNGCMREVYWGTLANLVKLLIYRGFL